MPKRPPEKLAEALRANLKRRKQPALGKAGAPPLASPADPVEPPPQDAAGNAPKN